MQPAIADIACDAGGWQALLRLGFVSEKGRTLLKQRTARGPLAVQRPFYPEGGLCHVYLLHPPGGVAGGDLLQLDVNVAEHAQALITTPGAGKVYRSDGRTAVQSQIFRVGDSASLEWFPQETIIFDGAHARMDTSIKLSSQARYIGWEIVCLGRPACQERYLNGESRFRFEVLRGHRPLLIEKLCLPGGASMLTENWGMRSRPVFATMLATPVMLSQLESLREQVASPGGTVGMTLLEDLLVCRYLGDDVEQAKKYFREIREILRPAIINKPAYSPRIWRT